MVLKRKKASLNKTVLEVCIEPNVYSQSVEVTESISPLSSVSPRWHELPIGL